MSKRKPKVEAWAVRYEKIPTPDDLVLVHTEKRAQQLAAAFEESAVTVFHLVPADPRRDAVVLAAVRLVKHMDSITARVEPSQDDLDLKAAVEKMQRGGK